MAHESNHPTHTIDSWAALHHIDIAVVSRSLMALSFPIADAAKVGASLTSNKLARVDRESALRDIIIPTFDRLLGPNVLRSALNGSISFVDSNCSLPPYTIDRGPNCPPQIHLPWTHTVQDLMWLMHEVSHAAQLALSEHRTMPPIARETCAFLGELALIDYAKDFHPKLGWSLQRVWRHHSSTYLGTNLDLLKQVLLNQHNRYIYEINYPLARMASVYLHSRATHSDAIALFKSGAHGMQLLCLDEALSSFTRNTQTNLSQLSTHAQSELQLQQFDPSWLNYSVSLKIVAGPKQVRCANDIPGGQGRWRSLGAFALAALYRGAANLTPSEFLKDFGQLATLPPPPFSHADDHFDILAAIGLSIHHLAHSPYHQHQKLSYYLPVEILPPLKAGQLISFVESNGTPAGLVTWAWLSGSVHADLQNTGRAINTNEWNCGAQLFFNDWITNPGTFRTIMTDMTERVFPDGVATSFRRNRDGTIRKVNRWKGKNVRSPSTTNVSSQSAVQMKSFAAATCHAERTKPRMCTCSSTPPQSDPAAGHTNSKKEST